MEKKLAVTRAAPFSKHNPSAIVRAKAGRLEPIDEPEKLRLRKLSLAALEEVVKARTKATPTERIKAAAELDDRVHGKPVVRTETKGSHQVRLIVPRWWQEVDRDDGPGELPPAA